jgi:Protein of unknown function (DUF1697)
LAKVNAYVALLRGIGPGNPNMRNERLRGVFAGLGFGNVRAVLASGNVLFEAPSRAIRAFETRIEAALPQALGFRSTAIIRSRNQLEALVNDDPFRGFKHSDETHLNVTFLKRKPREWQPRRRRGVGYRIVALYEREICSVVDLTSARTPDLMGRLEKELGKEITTRTYATIGRILRALNAE